MASSLTVAHEIHRLASSDERPLTPLELIKLTYLAHGWSLAKRAGKILVDEPVQAWQYGPVFCQLYYDLKGYRANAVPAAAFDDENHHDNPLTDEDKALIKAVYHAYKKYNGFQLSVLTHQDGSPWDITWHENRQNSVIDNNLIRCHYERLDQNERLA